MTTILAQALSIMTTQVVEAVVTQMAGMVTTLATTGILAMNTTILAQALSIMTTRVVEAVVAQMAGMAPTLVTTLVTTLATTGILAMETALATTGTMRVTLTMVVTIHHPLHAQLIRNVRTNVIP